MHFQVHLEVVKTQLAKTLGKVFEKFTKQILKHYKTDEEMKRMLKFESSPCDTLKFLLYSCMSLARTESTNMPSAVSTVTEVLIP